MAKRTRRVLTEQDKKARIINWANKVGLDGTAIAEQLIAKYGIDEAHQIAQDAMMKPHELAKKYGFTGRSSGSTLEYMAQGAAPAGKAPEAPTQAPVQTAPTAVRTAAPTEASIPQCRVAPPAKKKINTPAVEKNRQLRYQYIDTKFPQLKESDFASREEYMQALRRQYTEMRAYEWEMASQQEALDMYNLSRDKGYTPNAHVWDERENRSKNCPVDSAYRHQTPLPDVEWMDNGQNYASCAGTATRVNNAISERFGYKGKDRFYQAYSNCPSARDMHNNPATRKYRHENRSLKAMIEAGYVGPGTILSHPSGTTGSGYHALTVAEVIRDKNGKITDVVLQANNSTSLTRYSVDEIDAKLKAKDKAPRLKRPFIVTSTHIWASERIANEANGISDADLERMVNNQREQLYNSVERLAGIEDTTCKLNSDHVKTVQKQGTELTGMIEKAQPVVRQESAEFTYTDAERTEVRSALLGMTETSWNRVVTSDLARDMHASREAAEAQFEPLLSSYLTNNGKGCDKKTMKLASNLLVSFFAADGNKSLADFHQYVDNATKSNDVLNLALRRGMQRA